MIEPISLELVRHVEAFLYAEARMLEDNRFDDWLGCFADDTRYWMPVQELVQPSSGGNTEPDTFALFDDDKKSLQLRVLRIQTGEAHAEVPPSITSRLISNVMVEPGPDGALAVSSNFIVYQERRSQHGITFFGRRSDIIRSTDKVLQISSRKISLAQAILPTTISIFF